MHQPVASFHFLLKVNYHRIAPSNFFREYVKNWIKKEIKRENKFIGRLQTILQFLVLFSIYWAFLFFALWWTPVHIILIKTVHLSCITFEHQRQLQTKQSDTFFNCFNFINISLFTLTCVLFQSTATLLKCWFQKKEYTEYNCNI